MIYNIRHNKVTEIAVLIWEQPIISHNLVMHSSDIYVSAGFVNCHKQNHYVNYFASNIVVFATNLYSNYYTCPGGNSGNLLITGDN
jgi:hypothetical protein